MLESEGRDDGWPSALRRHGQGEHCQSSGARVVAFRAYVRDLRLTSSSLVFRMCPLRPFTGPELGSSQGSLVQGAYCAKRATADAPPASGLVPGRLGPRACGPRHRAWRATARGQRQPDQPLGARRDPAPPSLSEAAVPPLQCHGRGAGSDRSLSATVRGPTTARAQLHLIDS